MERGQLVGLLEPHTSMCNDRKQVGGVSNAGDKSVGPSVAPDEDTSIWKSSMSTPVKSLPHEVRDSANASGPLKLTNVHFIRDGTTFVRRVPWEGTGAVLKAYNTGRIIVRCQNI